MSRKSNQRFRIGLKYGCYDILDVTEDNGSFFHSYFKAICNTCGTVFERKNGAALSRKPKYCIKCRAKHSKRPRALKPGDVRGKFTILSISRPNNQLLVRCNKCGWTGYTNIVNIYHKPGTKRIVGCRHVDSKHVDIKK